ncbi:MAG: FeoA family protein [Spirochaetales bacterium]|nr:FeoA family protein [Spirochaetales bacterium]
MKLNDAALDKEYYVSAINACEEGMGEFLFTLGCFPGEKITVISQVASSYIVSIKDARYSIDENLAAAILVEDSSLATLAV